MSDFKLRSDKKETENKTIRFPLPLIEEINEVIKNEDVTFSGFVIQACEYALKNIEKKAGE
ncbi:YlcI/YnfO family protein [Vagococcus fluvialis]|uniref:YlcI/YnfO family protein n=1 Tax=Vagococcus fluvialis TaxID=2738 RepID=UPI003D0D0CA5